MVLKKIENHAHSVALFAMCYNFVCIHKTLRNVLETWEMAAVANNGLRLRLGEVSAASPTGYRWTQSPARGQPFQAAQHESRPPFRFFGIIEPQIWQAAQ